MNLKLFWLVFCSSTICVWLVSGCTATPTPVPTPAPTATLFPTATPAPTQPAKSVEQINTAWKTATYMDRLHLEKGMDCQACHQAFPPTAAPTMETCLGCHKNSYTELGKTTVKFEPRNPHTSHLGNEPCATCHKGHEPFVYHCQTCHTDWIYKGKYATSPAAK